ncbi:MAG: AmmeMemoRadiSam system radical SAM enzyme [bacterium]|jgi:pyruvate formate lyase activating enzyme
MIDTIKKFVKQGIVYEKLENNKVKCLACNHKCLIFDGKSGICKVRYNEGGNLFVPYNYVATIANDPIEKKPFFHVLPSSFALSYGMLGCNYHCSYCQNWDISQFLKDKQVKGQFIPISKYQIISLAKKYGSKVIVSTYNEPLITIEWSYEVFELAKQEGFLTGFVSNGYATINSLKYIRPVCDLYKVDLKAFNEKSYRRLGATLKGVLDSIINIKALGFHLEVVTLVIPGYNDSNEELANIAKFLYSVDKDIPWHVTAFHPDYKMSDTPSTPTETLIRAYNIGKEMGLNYVYTGNIPGLEYEHTYCPNCNNIVIKRYGFKVLEINMDKNKCNKCGYVIKGIFSIN